MRAVRVDRGIEFQSWLAGSNVHGCRMSRDTGFGLQLGFVFRESISHEANFMNEVRNRW